MSSKWNSCKCFKFSWKIRWVKLHFKLHCSHSHIGKCLIYKSILCNVCFKPKFLLALHKSLPSTDDNLNMGCKRILSFIHSASNIHILSSLHTQTLTVDTLRSFETTFLRFSLWTFAVEHASSCLPCLGFTGVLLSIVVKPGAQRPGSLLVLDARNLTELARAEVNTIIPITLHGTYKPWSCVSSKQVLHEIHQSGSFLPP